MPGVCYGKSRKTPQEKEDWGVRATPAGLGVRTIPYGTSRKISAQYTHASRNPPCKEAAQAGGAGEFYSQQEKRPILLIALLRTFSFPAAAL